MAGFSFGFGASRSRSKGKSDSESRSSGGSESGGTSFSGSQDTIAFEDIFAALFGSASNAAAGLDPSMLTEAANTLFSSGMNFMQGIGGDAGTAYLENRLSGDNPVLEEQIGLLQEDLGNFFNEELMPGITSNAVGGRQLGGGRQGVAQGAAIREVGNQFTRGATALRAGDISMRDRAASLLAGNAISGAQTAFGGMGALAGVADMGFSAGLAPYERLSAILGDPTVLGSSFSSAEEWARAWSESFSKSRSRTRSSGDSVDISGGFGMGGGGE